MGKGFERWVTAAAHPAVGLAITLVLAWGGHRLSRKPVLSPRERRVQEKALAVRAWCGTPAVAELRLAAAKGDAGAMLSLGLALEKGAGVARDPLEALHWLGAATGAGAPGAAEAFARARDDYRRNFIWYARAGSPELDGDALLEAAEVATSSRRAIDHHRRLDRNMLAFGTALACSGDASDRAEAAAWRELGLTALRAAVDRGDADEENLARILGGKVYGLPADYDEALKLYCRAAQDSPSCQRRLGHALHYGGGGVLRDDGRALDWYVRAAEGGDREAMRELGDAFHGTCPGWALPRDDDKALAWHSRAADAGDREALREVASALSGIQSGWSIPRDPDRARACYAQLIGVRGDKPSLAEVLAALNGSPPGWLASLDAEELLRWSLLAADGGDLAQLLRLGDWYRRRDFPVTDLGCVAALSYYYRAAPSDDDDPDSTARALDARAALAWLYHDGHPSGLKPDLAEALSWSGRAAELDPEWARRHAGWLLESDDPEDLAEAADWYRCHARDLGRPEELRALLDEHPELRLPDDP